MTLVVLFYCCYVKIAEWYKSGIDYITKNDNYIFVLRELMTMCLNLSIRNPCRPDEHQVSMLQGLESTGEHFLLQSQIETSYRTDALQHQTMSCQVRPYIPFHLSPLCMLVITALVGAGYAVELKVTCSHFVLAWNHKPQFSKL